MRPDVWLTADYWHQSLINQIDNCVILINRKLITLMSVFTKLFRVKLAAKRVAVPQIDYKKLEEKK